MKKSKDNWLDFKEWQLEQELKEEQLKEYYKNFTIGCDPYDKESNKNEILWIKIRNQK